MNHNFMFEKNLHGFCHTQTARIIIPHLISSARFFCLALTRILETVVTFHFSGGKVYSMNKGCHTCIIKHTMHVQ